MIIKAPPPPPPSQPPPRPGLLGVRIWVHWLQPRGFDIYEYLGVDGRLGIYMFRNRKTKITIGRLHAQTFNDPSWRPFLLDCEQARKEGTLWV